MTRVSISELKAQLSRYLREVRAVERWKCCKGHSSSTIGGRGVRTLSGAAQRRLMVKNGVIRAGKGKLRDLLSKPPLKVGTSISKALHKEREDRV